MNRELDLTPGPWTVVPEYDAMTGVFLIREIRQEAVAVEAMYEHSVELADTADAKRLERVRNAAKLIEYAEPMYQSLKFLQRGILLPKLALPNALRGVEELLAKIEEDLK